mgnify:CR=1 FL=1
MSNSLLEVGDVPDGLTFTHTDGCEDSDLDDIGIGLKFGEHRLELFFGFDVLGTALRSRVANFEDGVAHSSSLARAGFDRLWGNDIDDFDDPFRADNYDLKWGRGFVFGCFTSCLLNDKFVGVIRYFNLASEVAIDLYWDEDHGPSFLLGARPQRRIAPVTKMA